MGCSSSSRLDELNSKLDILIEASQGDMSGNSGRSGGKPKLSRKASLIIHQSNGGQSRRTDGFDAFISHSKKLPESEDRAVWIADIFECLGYTPFFDRSDLNEITEKALYDAMLRSDACVTVMDPCTFHSEWVFKENRLAYNAGIPIIPIYDADRFRWTQIQKWCNLYPWVFVRQTVPLTKDKRQASINKLVEAVKLAKQDGRQPPAEKIETSLAKVQVRVGAGGSRETETQSAVDSAHKAMLSRLSGSSPTVIIVTFTCTHDAQQVAARVHELCPNIPMIGCTTCRGVVLNSAWITHNKEYAVGMWCICDEGGTYTTIHIQKRQEGVDALRNQVVTELGKAMHVREDVEASFVVILGSPGDEEIILEGIQTAVGSEVPVLGGSSADNAVTGSWRQIAKAGVSSLVAQGPTVSEGGITVLVGWASCQIATTLTSGFRQTQKKGVVTKVDQADHGRTILQIDGKPVKEVYEKWTSGSITKDVQWDGDKATVLAPSSFCPLGECYDSSDQSYVRVMHPAFLYKSTGALTTFADAYEGMPVTLLDAAPETLAKKISQSAQQLMDQGNLVPMELQDVVGALMIFCGGLVMAIDDKMPLAAEQLGEVVGQQNTMGICCFGEQGMDSKRKARHGNLMFGCLLFSSKPPVKKEVAEKKSPRKKSRQRPQFAHWSSISSGLPQVAFRTSDATSQQVDTI